MYAAHERFIGDWTNTSGGYPHTALEGLSRRAGNRPELYKFQTELLDREGYYITEPRVVRAIEVRLREVEASESRSEAAEHLEELESYLYTEIAGVFGMMAVVAAAKRALLREQALAFEEGKQSAQKAMRLAIGGRS